MSGGPGRFAPSQLTEALVSDSTAAGTGPLTVLSAGAAALEASTGTAQVIEAGA